MLSGSTHVQKPAGGRTEARGSMGFLLLRVFFYIYISPNSRELCSWDPLQLLFPASSAVSNSTACFKILVDFYGEFSVSHFWKNKKTKTNMLESKTICFIWNQILYRERVKYRGSIFFTKSPEESWYFYADFFGIECNDPIVSTTQGGVTSSTVELCSGGPCHLCLFQTLLRILLTCHEVDAVSVSSGCAKSLATLVRSEQEKRFMGCRAASAVVVQASCLFSWHNKMWHDWNWGEMNCYLWCWF